MYITPAHDQAGMQSFGKVNSFSHACVKFKVKRKAGIAIATLINAREEILQSGYAVSTHVYIHVLEISSL